MQCMTYEPSLSLILWVVSIVDIEKEVMNIVELVIQVLKPCYAICMVCILCHVQILKLVENCPFKLVICMFSVLKRLIDLNGHGLWIIFSSICSTYAHFMNIWLQLQCLITLEVFPLGNFEFAHLDCAHTG